MDAQATSLSWSADRVVVESRTEGCATMIARVLIGVRSKVDVPGSVMWSTVPRLTFNQLQIRSASQKVANMKHIDTAPGKMILSP